MKILLLPTLLVLALAMALLPAAGAPPPDAAQTEINYLLASIGRSGCTFYRNGRWHDARSAQDHLRDKYEASAASGRIRTAEDFIDEVATKSSLSGLPYQVNCGATTLSSSRWLLDALARYRDSSTPGRPAAPRAMRGAARKNAWSSWRKINRPV